MASGVNVPPADEGGGHGQAGGDQLLQLGRLDGQHRVAGGLSHPLRERGRGEGAQPGGKQSGQKRIKGF